MKTRRWSTTTVRVVELDLAVMVGTRRRNMSQKYLRELACRRQMSCGKEHRKWHGSPWYLT